MAGKKLNICWSLKMMAAISRPHLITRRVTLTMCGWESVLSLMLSFPETSVVGDTIVEKLLRKIGLRPEVINEPVQHLCVCIFSIQYNKTKTAY